LFGAIYFTQLRGRLATALLSSLLKASLPAGKVTRSKKNKAVSVRRLKPLLITRKEVLSLQLIVYKTDSMSSVYRLA